MYAQVEQQEALRAAQEALDTKLEAYYKNNPDGGSNDELYAMAFRTAKLYKVNVNDLIY